jgi:hypothetical protein
MFALLLALNGAPTNITQEVVPAHPTCPPVRFVLKPGVQPSPFDETQVRLAQKGCPRHYPESPCLLALIKSGEGIYGAVCGSPE